MYECTSCIAVILSEVAHSLKASAAASSPEAGSASSVVNKTLKQILDHARTSGVVHHLCLCLESSGTSRISGSSIFLRVACEACRGIWSLIDALEVLSVKGSAIFPLNYLRSHSLVRLDIKDHDKDPWNSTDSEEIVDVITKAFLRSKAIQVAMYFCLHQRRDRGLSAAVQVKLKF